LDGDAGDFATTVAARKLIDILRSMPSDQTVVLESNQNKLLFKGGKSRFSLQTMAAEDFPLVQESAQFGPAFSLPQRTLKELLQQVSFAMAVHDIRYYPNGILFVADGKQLSLVATDGHRLAFASSTLDNEVPRQEVIDEMVLAQSGQTTLHNGHWARASTAVSLALLQSAHSGSPVTPDHQVAPVA
jgi:DNA polymerase-3 subunit beta